MGAIRLGRATILVVLVACTSACGRATVVSIRPINVRPGEGVVFGHVGIWNDGKEVTRKCQIAFTGVGKGKYAYISLDDSGWVFAAFPEGPTRLSLVSCPGWHELWRRTSPLVFNVAGHDKTTYFGHVGFHHLRGDADGWAAALEGAQSAPVAPFSLPGILLWSSVAAGIGDDHSSRPERPEREIAVVDDRSDEALVEYESRYGTRGAFDLFVSLAGRTGNAPEQSAPEIVRQGDVVSTDLNLSGVELGFRGTVAAGGSSLELQVRHHGRKPTLEACRDVEFTVDGVPVRLSASYRAERDPYYLRETLEVEKAADLSREIAGARSASLAVCGMTRLLSLDAMQATAKFVAAYDSLARAELARRAAAATRTDASPAAQTDAPSPPPEAGATGAQP